MKRLIRKAVLGITAKSFGDEDIPKDIVSRYCNTLKYPMEREKGANGEIIEIWEKQTPGEYLLIVGKPEIDESTGEVVDWNITYNKDYSMEYYEKQKNDLRAPYYRAAADANEKYDTKFNTSNPKAASKIIRLKKRLI